MLMVFFMLTSTLVRMVEFDIPKSNSRAKAPNKINVEVRNDGRMKVNDKTVTKETLEAVLREEIAAKKVPPKEVTITIVGEVGTTRRMYDLPIRAANRLKAKAIVATEPNQ
jgi:biopolymer transport protein ExbD